MASAGLLSLKWNNHKTTFFHVLSSIRSKEAYCDVTIACDGRFYPVHKLVMSTCSDYFKEMFERTNCKHPVIVLKDIRHEDIEALLNYMYLGEVNVLQNELAGLIKAAECLMIKGLAVPDESPDKESTKDTKRVDTEKGSPQAKRKRYDDSDNNRYEHSNISGRASLQKQSDREPSSSSNQQKQSARHSSNASDQSPSRRQPASSNHSHERLPDDQRSSQVSRKNNNFQNNPENSRSQDKSSNLSQRTEAVVVLDEPSQVKEEPEEIQEVEEVLEDTKDVLESSFSYEHLSEGDSMSNVGDGGNQDAQGFDGQVLSGGPQSMEDLVAQAIPGSSGMEMSSLWESDGSLQGLPPEAFGDNQGPPQMVIDGYESGNLEETPVLNIPQIIKQGRFFVCPICQYQTFKKDKLQRHMRTHTGEKPFPCPYCPHRATQKQSLQNHIRTHTGEKPFACSQCPYRSAQKGSLNNHILNIHVNK